ncbi:phosphotransferase [Streptomyces decoyicus]|uniref:Phosphotransferase n=1 Tax=Streptomyces decoyicus TaxID=249567 RepID=A0ABZ1FMJ4_9ACTN|nr:phosphotransferase [Streptomyces decoyicus]WSB71655.1 phosphotransferase [Streptomyces decoyicus]
MATYTKLDQIDLPAVSERYGLRDPQLEPLKGGAANSSFHVSSPSGDFTLTILDNHDIGSAQSLATYTQAVYRLGVPTTEVVPALDGALITTFDGRPVILKKWIQGEVRQPLPIPLLPEAGRILAQLHALAPESEGLGDLPVGTRRLSAEQLDVIPQFADREFAAWLAARLKRVRSAEAGSERSRKIAHGDLFADNVIVRDDGALSVLDWETVSLDDPLLDLGMAAVGLAAEGDVLVPERLNALVTGYQTLAPLSEADAAALPLEIEHAACIIAFHRYYRHNVRFPDASKSTYHLKMIKFVESVGAATRPGRT